MRPLLMKIRFCKVNYKRGEKMESNIEEEKLRGIIEESVDESVKQAFK